MPESKPDASARDMAENILARPTRSTQDPRAQAMRGLGWAILALCDVLQEVPDDA